MKACKRVRWLCLLLLIPMALSCAHAKDDGAPAPSSEAAAADPSAPPSSNPSSDPSAPPSSDPSASPTPDPSSGPSASPTPDPSSDPSASPSSDPSSNPSVSPSSDPSSDPSAPPTLDPSSHPSASPSSNPSSDPSASPTPDPSSDPSASPTLDPSASPEATPSPANALDLRVEGCAPNAENLWQIALSPDMTEIVFLWNPVEGATGYLCELTDEQANVLQSLQQAECRLALPAQDFRSGRFKLSVRALQGEAILLEASLLFEQAQSGRPDFPGGFHGGFPSGGRAPSGAPEQEMGFRVVAGEALTSSHASGTKDMRLYGAVALESTEAPVQRLSLDDADTAILLDGGNSAFTVRLEDGALWLTPETDGEVWSMSARALTILQRSGVSEVIFSTQGEPLRLSTHLEFCGTHYAALRAQGLVSKDFLLLARSDGLSIEVSGARYALSDEGALVPSME